MRLSPHFTLTELTSTSTGFDNIPGPTALHFLVTLAETLEKVRSVLGNHPIKISSGFRSPEVNKAVDGSRTSAHMTGQAVDFTCPDFGTPLEVCEAIRRAGIEVDQVIHEYGRWVHLGINPSPRRQFLTIDKQGTRTGLLEARL